MESYTSLDLALPLLIGSKVPVFRAMTSHGSVYIPAEINGNWIILLCSDFNSLQDEISCCLELGLEDTANLEISIKKHFGEKVKMNGLKQSGKIFQNPVIAYFIDPAAVIRAVVGLPTSSGEDMASIKLLINMINTNIHILSSMSANASLAQIQPKIYLKLKEELGIDTSSIRLKEPACDCFFCTST